MRTLLTLPYLTIYLHDGAVPVLETHWLGFATSVEFRAAVKQALAFGRQYQVRGWVANDQQLGAVRPRDLAWIHEDLLLTLDRLGLQRYAVVEADDALNRLTIAGMYEQARESVGFEIRRFDDSWQARAWAGEGE